MKPTTTLTVFAILSVLGGCAMATSPDETAARRDPSVRQEAGLSQAEADRVMEALEALYRPEAEALGASLDLVWSEAENPGASARQDRGRRWSIRVRRGTVGADLSRDGFTAMMCHELGHLFSGFPFRSGNGRSAEDFESLGHKAAGEGQSDYFATKDCLPRVFANSEHNAGLRVRVPESVAASCDAAWGDVHDREICQRSALAYLDLMRFLHEESPDSGEPLSFDTPSTQVVDRYQSAYPSHQCRVDTALAGALCPARIPATVIPGHVQNESGVWDVHSPEATAHAAPYACHGETPGARPRCWFGPTDLLPPNPDCPEVPWARCDGAQATTCWPSGTTTVEECTSTQTCVVFGDSAFCEGTP